MNLYRRDATGPWYVNIRLSNGSRLRQSTGETDHKKAQVQAQRMLVEANTAITLDKDGRKPITIEAALGLYVGSLKASKKSSARFFEALSQKALGTGSWAPLGRFKLPPGTYLHDLTPALLEALKQARRAEGNSAQTAKHELSLLRATSLYVKGLRYRVADIDDWRLPSTPTKTRYLSWEEFQAVYAAMDPDRLSSRVLKGGGTSKPTAMVGSTRDEMVDARDLLVALAMCGGRWSEVAALTWDRVDLPGRTLRLFATKADAGERHVAIPDQFAEILERRAAQRTPGQPLVFPGKHGAQRVQSCRAIVRAINAAGLNRADIVARYGKATVHSLRHTFASLLLQGGADLSEVQESLGHTTIAMTRRYAHLSKGKTLTKLGGIMSALGAGVSRVDPGKPT